MHPLYPNQGWTPLSDHVFAWDEPLVSVPPIRKLVIHNGTYVTRRLDIVGQRLTGHFYAPPGISVFCFCNPLAFQALGESIIWLKCSQPSLNLCAYGSAEEKLAVSLGPRGHWFMGRVDSPTEDRAVVRQGLSLLYDAEADDRPSLFRTCTRVCDTCANLRH